MRQKMKTELMMKKFDIIVVGGGAAGMMAASFAAEKNKKVLLIEKNKRVGRKIAITGKGRCNLTNFCDNDEFINNITSNQKFLFSAINNFSCYDTIDFFENLGVETKVERGNRVFPKSDKAVDIANAMHKNLVDKNVEIIYNPITDIIVENKSVSGVKLVNNQVLEASKIILACGGMSYSSTGSNGDGYKFAKKCGHTIKPILPSLVPLESSNEFCARLKGLSLKNVKISVVDNTFKREVYSDFGEMLFTHFGLSGPIILSASAHMRNMSKNRYSIIIDLKPALDFETLDKRVVRDLADNKNKDIINSLSALLPKSIIPVVLSLSCIDYHSKCNAVTAEMRHKLVKTLKNFTVNISKFRPIDEAIVTCGGVCVDEINPKTMESKITKGLYFAGEMMDVDAYTGGFNLQIAFSTGVLAGKSAAQSD